LDNRICFLDYNGIQIDGYNKDIKDVTPLEDKFLAFRWAVKSIDGNDIPQILDAIAWAKATKGKPKMIIAKTVMGKGVSIFENLPKYHGVAPSDAELAIALKELGA
jgi:transketolase